MTSSVDPHHAKSFSKKKFIRDTRYKIVCGVKIIFCAKNYLRVDKVATKKFHTRNFITKYFVLRVR